MLLHSVPSSSIRFDLEYIARGVCSCCGRRAIFFVDKSSEAYFYKTGLCQECQDSSYVSYEEASHGRR